MLCLSNYGREYKIIDVKDNVIDNKLYQILIFYLLNQFISYASLIIEVLVLYYINLSDILNI